MDSQKAIKHLKESREYCTSGEEESYKEALGIAILALEKQISKKVENSNMKFKVIDTETKKIYMCEAFPCPICDKWISKIYKYCPHCGQRIMEAKNERN